MDARRDVDPGNAPPRSGKRAAHLGSFASNAERDPVRLESFVRRGSAGLASIAHV